MFVDSLAHPRAEPRPLVVWHAGWVAASLLTALLARALGADEPAQAGAVALALAGLGGLTLLIRDGDRERFLVFVGWCLAALAAAALAGGLTGAVGAFLFMPAAAGLALGGRRLGVWGLGAVSVALLAGAGASFLAPPAPNALPAMISGLVALGGSAAAVWLTFWERDLPGAASLDQRPGLALVLDPDGVAIDVRGEPPAGLDRAALASAGIVLAAAPADRGLVQAAIQAANLNGQGEAAFAPAGDSARRVRLLLKRLDDGGLAGLAVDDTAQRRRELALDVARVEAEARDQGKSRFLANMSHELRTPLNAVLGFSDIMRQRLFGPIPQRYAAYADSIHEAGRHLLDLINDVLDMSKIEAERYDLNIERFDAREAITAALALMKVQALEGKVSLSAVLPDTPLDVDADRRALKQMVLNLISNAVKFTPAEGAVTVTLEALGRDLELVVSDTGVGIAPEDIERLGRPYEQAGAAEQRSRGTGLGLSLVRLLAELHGGRLSIESTVGEGAAVTVRMPVVVVEAMRSAPPVSAVG